MKFFNNRIVATCILIVGVVVSTFISAGNKLEDKVWDVESQFYWSSSGSKAIQERLEDRCDAASNLVSIAYNYPNVMTETETLRFAHTELYDHLWSDDFSALYDANEDIEPAFQTLYRALSEEDLTETDLRAVESYATTFNGAQRMINESDYNQTVDAFVEDTLDRFPASFFVRVLDIEEPQRFE